MKIFFTIKITIFYLFVVTQVVAAQTSYFDKGKELYENKKYDKSRIFFERDIVFNPLSEKSYLFLAKIFKKNENNEEEEINLNNVMLINPKNDEAIYLLMLLKINQSDYKKTKELLVQFNLVCKSFCAKEDEIKKKLNKQNPENEKNKN